MTPTPAHFNALGQLLSLLPVEDVIALVNGTATVNSGLDLLGQLVGVVQVAFPPAAMDATAVGYALALLKFLLDEAGVGEEPLQVTGGVPGAFPSGGGPGPYRSGK